MKGAAPQWTVDDPLLCAAELQTLIDCPYSELKIPVIGNVNTAALAGNFAYAYVRPGPSANQANSGGVAIPFGYLFRLRQLIIRNTGAAAGFRVAYLNEAERAAFGGAGPAQMLRLRTIGHSDQRESAAANIVGTAYNASAAIGNGIAAFSLAAGADRTLDIDAVLYGGPATSLGVWASPAISVNIQTLNQTFDLTAIGEEWPLVDA